MNCRQARQRKSNTCTVYCHGIFISTDNARCVRSNDFYYVWCTQSYGYDESQSFSSSFDAQLKAVRKRKPSSHKPRIRAALWKLFLTILIRTSKSEPEPLAHVRRSSASTGVHVKRNPRANTCERIVEQGRIQEGWGGLP